MSGSHTISKIQLASESVGDLPTETGQGAKVRRIGQCLLRSQRSFALEVGGAQTWGSLSGDRERILRAPLGTARPSCPRSKLQYASRPDHEDQRCAEHHSEQEGDGERRVRVRTVEVHLDTLKVQQDEDQQQHQQDQRRGHDLPGCAQACRPERRGRGLSLLGGSVQWTWRGSRN
jgi:hypothetical protein